VITIFLANGERQDLVDVHRIFTSREAQLPMYPAPVAFVPFGPERA
jgi:hypothetical protein